MYCYRYWKDGSEDVRLTVRYDRLHHVRWVMSAHTTKLDSVEPCGKMEQVDYSRVIIVNNKAFVERWSSPARKDNFRKDIVWELADRTIARYYEIIKGLHSDSESVLEVEAMIVQAVNDYEIATRP